ncbi:MAG TPA: cytochrome c [Solirubrobacterales bacterium]|jgi:cytochrome c5|nr:cytochrome c [Solirubrobacterales bacterium]
MIVSKSPKVLILFAILALAAALVVAGCGGSGGTTATGQGPAPGSNVPEKTEEPEAEEGAAEEGGTPEATEEEPAGEEATEEEPAGEAPGEETEEAGGKEESGASAAMMSEGMTVFTTNCASCHTLKEAGTSGTIGPNLDELEPSESTVEHQVINGGGPMPAFGNDKILKPEEIKAVAAYVSSVAGTE